MTRNRKSKVFKFGTGQWAMHQSSGANVIVEGIKRSPIGLLVVARVTSGRKKGQRIEAKATSFAPRKSGPKRLAPLALVA